MLRTPWRRREAHPHGRRRTDHEPNRGWKPVLAIVFSVALLDWAVKATVHHTVPVGGFVSVWEGRVAIWHVKNAEMALGLWGNLSLGGRQAIAVVAAAVALLLFFEVVGRGHRLPPNRRPWVWAFVGLAFGGMLGNLGERAYHWVVTDYLSFAWGTIWLPPGNVADIGILLSVPLAVPVIIFELRARARRRRAPDRRAAKRLPASA